MNRYNTTPHTRRVNATWRKEMIRENKRQARRARLTDIVSTAATAATVALVMLLLWAFTCVMLAAFPNVAASGY